MSAVFVALTFPDTSVGRMQFVAGTQDAAIQAAIDTTVFAAGRPTWVRKDQAWSDQFSADKAAEAASAIPTYITPKQGKLQLLAMGLISPTEAVSGVFPAFLQAVIDQLVLSDPAQAAAVSIAWRDAVEWDRTDPIFAGGLLAAAAAALNVPATPELVDQFFANASKL